MGFLKWTSDLETGISVIDHQHRRIVDYINQLHHAIEHSDRDEVGEVLEQLVEYTMSHFAFEEDLQEEAGYPFVKAHKRVHDLFTRKMSDFQNRFELGEDIARPLLTTLRTWLINHIQRDDADYVQSVKVLEDFNSPATKRRGFFSRLFAS